MSHLSALLNVVFFPTKVAVAVMTLPFALAEAEERRQTRAVAAMTYFPADRSAQCRRHKKSA